MWARHQQLPAIPTAQATEAGRRKVTYLVTIATGLGIWAVAEGFGGPYTTGSIDIGTACIYALVAAALLRQDVRVATRVDTAPVVAGLLAEHGLTRFHLVPHTHWDREWYRPFEHFRLELARVVDGVITALEHDPEFTSFTLDGQAIVLEDYVDVRPENEARLRALLAAGRIEVGPSYVLPDELLVCAESLVRNLLLGRAVCRRFGVDPSPVGYLPDSFGHPAQLAQILAGFGIQSFIFSRGLGDELDRTGVVFEWRAPDGSEVLAFQQLADYSNFAAVAGVDDAIARIGELARRFGPALAAAGVHDVLLCNGSDHLPVQPELPRLCADLERLLPATSFAIAAYRDYVRAVGRPAVGAHEGELLGSRLQNVLRGVNSARMYIKRANERAERRLLCAETLAALVALRDRRPFPGQDFEVAWRDLLRCQPHDSICGCSCDEVHRDMLARYESLHRTLAMLEARALDRGPGDGRVAIFNPLPFPRRRIIDLLGAEAALVELDGFAGATVELASRSRSEPLDGDAIESDLLRAQTAADGSLTVIDRRDGRRFEGLHLLEDEPDVGDLYNFCPRDGANPWRSEGATTRVLRAGPLVWELERRVETASVTVVTVVRLARGSRRVEFHTTVDNRAPDHRLRVAFGAGASESVRAEAQFAVVRRPLSPPDPQAGWVEPPDATQHTLGAVAAGAIVLLTKGLPEYEARPGGDLVLTLLRCVGVISRPAGLATRPRAAGPAVQTPEGQCLGRHEFEYALLIDGERLDDLALLRESQDYRYCFLTVGGGAGFEPPLALEGDVVFSCLKGAQDGDGLILRCFNPLTASVRARVTGPFTVARTRLDETDERPARHGPFELGPHEIATLRLRPTT